MTHARLTRPRLLLLLLGVVVAASAAAILAANPSGMTDHQALTDLSVPAIVAAGFLDGCNPCAFGVLILFATFALGLAAQQSLAAVGTTGRPDAGGASRAVLGLGGSSRRPTRSTVGCAPGPGPTPRSRSSAAAC